MAPSHPGGLVEGRPAIISPLFRSRYAAVDRRTPNRTDQNGTKGCAQSIAGVSHSPNCSRQITSPCENNFKGTETTVWMSLCNVRARNISETYSSFAIDRRGHRHPCGLVHGISPWCRSGACRLCTAAHQREYRHPYRLVVGYRLHLALVPPSLHHRSSTRVSSS